MNFEFYYILSFAIPICLLIGMPKLLRAYSANERKFRVFLYVSLILFAVSWYLPSPLIDGQNTSFSTHFVGGGMFTAFFWEYIRRSLKLKIHLLLDGFLLFCLVSGLGAINEIFELVAVLGDFYTITLTDTSYDIFANTLGASLVWLGIVITSHSRRSQ